MEDVHQRERNGRNLDHAKKEQSVIRPGTGRADRTRDESHSQMVGKHDVVLHGRNEHGARDIPEHLKLRNTEINREKYDP